jgi:TRAP-type C4-dicarboxylate transport system permease large subunit
VSGVPVETLMRATIPFLIPLFLTLLVVTYFAGIVMFIPNLME